MVKAPKLGMMEHIIAGLGGKESLMAKESTKTQTAIYTRVISKMIKRAVEVNTSIRAVRSTKEIGSTI